MTLIYALIGIVLYVLVGYTIFVNISAKSRHSTDVWMSALWPVTVCVLIAFVLCITTSDGDDSYEDY
jgi:FtsH-binding integral membrane protein